MSKFTVTVSDLSGSLSVELAGDQVPKTTAYFVALALGQVLPSLIEAAARAAAKEGQCPCPKCRAGRESGQTSGEAKATLH